MKTIHSKVNIIMVLWVCLLASTLANAQSKYNPKYLREDDKVIKAIAKEATQDGWIRLKDNANIKKEEFFAKLGKNIGIGKDYEMRKVKDLLPDAKEPFSYLEFDIKYVWVGGKQKNAQILTVIDVYSRWNVGQYIGFSIESQHVKKLFEDIFKELYLPTKFFVRNDNGSQFIANEVQEFFVKKGVTQEFTKPATPQQNAHIESYHSIMESVICQRFELNDINELRKVMQDFRNFYNFERIHGGIGFVSPFEYLQLKNFNINLINNQPNLSLI
jgi:putative transposase